jgi:threonine/homoserine/homoserine lactone efflux protein
VFVALAAFVFAAGLLTITPGVDTAMVLRASAAQGPRAGAAAGIGVALGLMVWGAGAALGLNALMATSSAAFAALKWAGAVYLVWLGLRLLLRPRAAVTGPSGAAAGLGGSLRRGFLTNVLNPKVGVFYATFLPQFIPAGANVAVFSLLLAGIHAALTLIWFAALVAMTIPIGRRLAEPGVVKALDRLTGSVFVAFGVRLALAERG